MKKQIIQFTYFCYFIVILSFYFEDTSIKLEDYINNYDYIK